MTEQELSGNRGGARADLSPRSVHDLWLAPCSYLARRRGGQLLFVDYPLHARPRYGYGVAPHPELHRLIENRRSAYDSLLQQVLAFEADFVRIPISSAAIADPVWLNPYLPGVDAALLYAFVSTRIPGRYVEVGSGFSTRFVRRAINDRGLPTRIISIDPNPRAEVDALCDDVIRQRLEDCDLSAFGELRAGDVVFFDGTHRCFTNSDVTVAFLEILPRLAPGVLVGFHDVFLPFDYPASWSGLHYSEQYLLATHLLAGDKTTKIVFPAAHVGRDRSLSGILARLWSKLALQPDQVNGTSFWIEPRMSTTGPA